MKKIALSIAFLTFLTLGASSLQSVVAASTGIEIARVDDDKKKEEPKKKECAPKKKCCSDTKAEKCDEKKSDDKK